MEQSSNFQIFKILKSGDLHELQIYVSTNRDLFDTCSWKLNKSYDSAAHVICRNNHVSLLSYLLHLNSSQCNFCSLLRHSNLESLPIQSSPSSIEYTPTEYQRRILESLNREFKRPLHEAAQTGSVECIRLLLAHGATVDPFKIADWYICLAP